DMGVSVREVPPGPARRAFVPLIRLAEDSDAQLAASLDDGTLYAVDDIGVVLVLDHAEGERELRYVAVAKPRQREGIGRQMLAAVESAERARGTRRLLVGTSAADPGNLAFYQRCGFRLLSVERDYFSPARGYPADFTIDGLLAVDMVWMDMSL
ncbi:MAG TPA: GNAT family N-acetyltransferase, partial [Acidimicrobiales bacterium]|nr:GNAT family N-acetyltransferase [Acidimicrobiales bacterium]